MPNPNGPLCAAFFVVPAFGAGGNDGLCALIAQMQGVFQTLRILAFVGAGFVLAKSAWEFISTGKLNGKEGVEGLKTVGVPMLIGFALLFSIGVILSMLMQGHLIECAGVLGRW
ncbi:hypothetical protein HDR63_03725 [bacterium]|nr:hypothetical protein [bacterium]